MSSLIVEGNYIATMDEERNVIRDGAIYVEGERITDIGPAQHILDTYSADRVIGGDGKVVFPGFVNAHDHLFITLTRSLGEDLPLLEWLQRSVFPTSLGLDEESFYKGAKLCLLEMIKSGVTHFMDDSLPYIPFDRKDGTELIEKAASEIGVGGITGIGAPDMDLDGGVPEVLVAEPEDILETSEALMNQYNNEDSILDVWANPSYPLWCSGELFQDLKTLADNHDTWIYTHVAEDEEEVALSEEMFGMRPVEYLDSLGILDSNCLLAHVNKVTKEEIQRIADTGTSMSHQAICNQFLAAGVAPVPEMLERGINVGLGIDDGGHSNEDFLSLMKHTVLLHKIHNRDAGALSAEQVLETATIRGSRAIGKGEEMGSLEPGKKANMAIFDQVTPNLTPRVRPVTNIVYGATAADVVTTIIDGRVVMLNNEVQTVDEASILEEAQKAATQVIKRADLDEMVTRSSTGWDYPYR